MDEQRLSQTTSAGSITVEDYMKRMGGALTQYTALFGKVLREVLDKCVADMQRPIWPKDADHIQAEVGKKLMEHMSYIEAAMKSKLNDLQAAIPTVGQPLLLPAPTPSEDQK